MNSNITLPRIIRIGQGASQQLVEVMQMLGVKSPLIITDNMMVKLGYIDRLSNLLNEHQLNFAVYSDTVPEPTVKSLTAGIELARSGKFDCIVALGGGSPIDSAKAISIVSYYGGEVRDYKVPRKVMQTGLPLIAIPTTAGTGSEVTSSTVITDEDHNEKMLCTGLGFMPIASLVDYELTLSLPARVTADCGLDALTHAMEAYVSKKNNPFSDVQALAALSLIARNLRTAYHQPDNHQARAAMMFAAHLAGIAFSNASVALVHGMSRPIGAHFHVPHGLSNAMLLPIVTRYSIPGATSRYAECARAMGIASASDDNNHACDLLLKELQALNHELQVPGLQTWGVDRNTFVSLLPLMAEQALASGSPANNPRVPSPEEMISLYEQCYG